MTFVASLAAAGIGFGLSILLTRGLTTEGLGTYALALLLPNTMVLLLDFGITYANVFFIGRGEVNARLVMRANLWIWAFVTVIGLMAAGVIIWLEGGRVVPGDPDASTWSSPCCRSRPTCSSSTAGRSSKVDRTSGATTTSR